MDTYDLIVVGGGTGNNVAEAAADAGMETALIEKGPLGGTCLNRGCNPSKMLIQHANVASTVQEAERFHVDATVESIDYEAIVDWMDESVSDVAESMESRFRDHEHLTVYQEEAHFTGPRTLAVEEGEIRGESVLVAAGSRPILPDIDGLEDVEYLTSDDALFLRDQPESLVILGGGYIALELGYFFETMGTDVTIIEKHDVLVHREDHDISTAITDVARDRHEVHTGFEATAVAASNGAVDVRIEATDGDETRSVAGEELLVAVGRQSNADTLDLGRAGIETDDRDLIETDEYLATSAENVWAQGDIAGNFFYKHAGDYETRYMIRKLVDGDTEPIEYTAMPHAIFTEPQVAGVGQTEAELREAGTTYRVGRAEYADTAMGRAKRLEDEFVKVLAAPDGGILGCHILGTEASTLIHEVVVAMREGSGAVSDVAESIHAHPTLSKVLESAFRDVDLD